MTVDVELKKKESTPSINIDALDKEKKQVHPQAQPQAKRYSAPKDRGILIGTLDFLFCDCTMFAIKCIWYTLAFLGKGLFYIARGIGHVLHGLMEIFN